MPLVGGLQPWVQQTIRGDRLYCRRDITIFCILVVKRKKSPDHYSLDNRV